MPMICRYTGDSLSALVSEASFAATDRAARAIATDTQRVMHTTAVSATPVRSGATRESWLAPLVRHKGQYWEARIVNTSWLAFWLEHGTQAHEIRPKKRPGHHAEMTPAGPRAGAHHPGFAGHHMTAIAGQVAETILPMTAERSLRAYVGELELAIEMGKHR